MIITATDLSEVIRNHGKWLRDEEGTCANLIGANLRGADLRGANLSGADLIDANLMGANLRGVNLQDANIRAANLQGANIQDANLRGANLSGANLSNANLMDADLSGADLSDVSLMGAVGNMREIFSLQLDAWPVTFTQDVMQIGCQRHSISDWWQFSDKKIQMMSIKALYWWKKWKPTLRQIVEMSLGDAK